MITDLLTELGIIAIIIVVILIICIPIIVGIIIAMAVANWLAVSGILWWAIVIFVAMVIWGILGALS